VTEDGDFLRFEDEIWGAGEVILDTVVNPRSDTEGGASPQRVMRTLGGVCRGDRSPALLIE